MAKSNRLEVRVNSDDEALVSLLEEYLGEHSVSDTLRYCIRFTGRGFGFLPAMDDPQQTAPQIDAISTNNSA